MSFSAHNSIINRIEEWLLSLLLIGMIVLSCLQIILRLFFDGGLLWADPLLRQLVVWGGFLGAVLAVSRGKHITLDILSHFLPLKLKRLTNVVTLVFSSSVCGFLTYASCRFLVSEMEFGSTSLLSIPSWGWNMIFPLSFAAMTIRYFFAAITATYKPDSSEFTVI